MEETWGKGVRAPPYCVVEEREKNIYMKVYVYVIYCGCETEGAQANWEFEGKTLYGSFQE